MESNALLWYDLPNEGFLKPHISHDHILLPQKRHHHRLSYRQRKRGYNMFGFEWNEEEERKALIELGEERGEQRGEKRSTINSIRNLMKNMHWSAEEAMAAIGIEQSQYKQYLALL